MVFLTAELILYLECTFTDLVWIRNEFRPPGVIQTFCSFDSVFESKNRHLRFSLYTAHLKTLLNLRGTNEYIIVIIIIIIISWLCLWKPRMLSILAAMLVWDLSMIPLILILKYTRPLVASTLTLLQLIVCLQFYLHTPIVHSLLTRRLS